MTAARNVSATFAIRTYTLSVSTAGAGWGTVTSNPAGIDCGNDCSEIYELFTVLILTATAAPNSVFTGWSGSCSGTGDCILNMTGPRSVTATFALKTWLLSVAKAGGGNGSVTSAPTGINCGTDCAEPYPPGTTVALTAGAVPYSTFTGWSGSCKGKASTCLVTMDANKKAVATFKLNADLRLTNTDAPDPVQVGKTLAYTVAVTNLGPNGSSLIKVNDLLPLPVIYGSATPSQGSVTTTVTGTGATKLVWAVGALGAGATATVTIRVTPRVATTLTNTPSVTSSKTFDPVAANNKQTAVTTVVP
jgi:uncharacterized repeat protein (TIGR01451 family)